MIIWMVVSCVLTGDRKYTVLHLCNFSKYVSYVLETVKIAKEQMALVTRLRYVCDMLQLNASLVPDKNQVGLELIFCDE